MFFFNNNNIWIAAIAVTMFRQFRFFDMEVAFKRYPAILKKQTSNIITKRKKCTNEIQWSWLSHYFILICMVYFLIDHVMSPTAAIKDTWQCAVGFSSHVTFTTIYLNTTFVIYYNWRRELHSFVYHVYYNCIYLF